MKACVVQCKSAFTGRQFIGLKTLWFPNEALFFIFMDHVGIIKLLSQLINLPDCFKALLHTAILISKAISLKMGALHLHRTIHIAISQVTAIAITKMAL